MRSLFLNQFLHEDFFIFFTPACKLQIIYSVKIGFKAKVLLPASCEPFIRLPLAITAGELDSLNVAVLWSCQM